MNRVRAMNKGIVKEGNDTGPFVAKGQSWFAKQGAYAASVAQRLGVKGKGEVLYRWTTEMSIFVAGAQMEKVQEKLEEVNETLKESKKITSELCNEIYKISKSVEAALDEQAMKLRAARTTVVQELNVSLSSLRDIRRFFLEPDYKQEIQRLETFLSLCDRFKALKDCGVLDAVCDTAIRMASKKSAHD